MAELRSFTMTALRDLYDRLLEVAPGERTSWLDAQGIDGELRRRLLSMVDADDGVVDPLRRPAAERLADLAGEDEGFETIEAWVGRRVGAFRLRGLLGEGGMAAVFLGEREGADFDQQVAIKLLKRGLYSTVEQRLFRRERQALAALSHPNIARLIDGGVTDTGVPYLAMEYVDGVPLTRYAIERRLGVRERLRLLLTVCRAVDAAHRALIVHRDLKPSNILVAADGTPKLLDFGITKLLDDEAEHTRTGFGALTPEYAAPEQFAGGPITTATDVYALGVLLHELLLGERPSGARARRPSLRAGALETGTPTLPEAPTTLRRKLRGDLDNITLKSLESEPARRYASAGALADDLDRYLRGQPVDAHPPARGYRLSKFVQRHRGGVAVAAVLSAAMLISIGVALWQGLVARQQAQLARQQAERAETVRDFVVELFNETRPGGGFDTPMQLLERAPRRARGRFGTNPDIRAELLLVLGNLARAYGQLDTSRGLLDEAAPVARQHGGPASPLWLEAEAHLGHTAFRQGHFRDAATRLARALTDYDAAGGPAGAARVRALMILGMLRGDDAEHALRLQDEALRLARRALARTDPLQQTVRAAYGEALLNAGRRDEARPVLIESLALARRLYGDRDLIVVSALESLAVYENVHGTPEAARPLLLEAEQLLGELVKGPHVVAAYVANTRGVTELYAGDAVAAQRAFDHALAIYRALVGPPHGMLIATHQNLGAAALEQERAAEAATHFDEAARQRDALAESFASLHPRCLAAAARVREAATLATGIAELERCGAELRGDAGAGPYYLAALLGTLADARWRAGEHAAAERLAREALSLRAAPTLHERLLPVLVLARAALAAGDRDGVHAQAGAALAIEREARRTMPCAALRELRELAELAELAGAAHAEVDARALRARADAISCRRSHGGS
jgi:serine/threonine-protein kinase